MTSIRNALALCFLLSSTLVRAELLSPYEAVYNATYYGQTGEAKRGLNRLEDGRYEAYFNTDISVLFIKFYQHQTSHLSITNEAGVVPHSYRYRGTRSRDATDLVFDWELSTVANEGKTSWSKEVTKGQQDELSYQEQIRIDLINGRSELHYPVVEDADKQKTLRFQRLETEVIDTPLGSVEAIKVKRVRKKGKDRETVFWFAPQWEHMLVRIEHVERGSGYRIDLQSVTLNGNVITAPAP
ncbi:DUF3108 domain-containing protein [Aestuariirhabdus sp. Z084]|uniref:DUF3108 domain-containing protein n=1 Tax=Aestuariirhabdus haliotis TaxID=2918751 RepID=UPI00201B437B|nr:DUF3108 domain-containing protein [Aestuariirhabdus haliotis]MCL6416291.1 DUF3108 domain-containing protein [Aestuariirhabdus haliotis]MCL6420164.1 DUF3108 domain-containing protein [Aestuariirhabdus haliotis]